MRSGILGIGHRDRIWRFYDDIYEQTIVPVIPMGRAEEGAENMRDVFGTVRLELLPEEEEGHRMNKQVVILSGSPREGGNSDTLCNEFQRGCEEAGHRVRKISLRDKRINFCQACYSCKKPACAPSRTMFFAVLQEMVAADVIALATPVYFYSMAGQMKTLIDRSLSCGAKLAGKEFYLIATASGRKSGNGAYHRRVVGLYRLPSTCKSKGRHLWSGSLAVGRYSEKSRAVGSLSDGQKYRINKTENRKGVFIMKKFAVAILFPQLWF